MSFSDGLHRGFNNITFCAEHNGRRTRVLKGRCQLCGAQVEITNVAGRRKRREAKKQVTA